MIKFQTFNMMFIIIRLKHLKIRTTVTFESSNYFQDQDSTEYIYIVLV